MKKTLAIVLTVLVCQASQAQIKRGGDHIDVRIAKLDSQVNLTDLQETQIRQILEDKKSTMQALRADSTAQKGEIREIRKAVREEIHQVLTQEQREKLQASKDKRRGPGHRDSKLKAQRGAFDTLLSIEEKDLIENARKMLPAQRRQMHHHKDSLSESERKELRQKKQAVLNSLSPVIENHKEELLEVERAHLDRKKSNQTRKSPEDRMGKPKSGDKFSYKFLLMKP